MPPVEPGIRCILRSTIGAAIEPVFPVLRPATITVALAPISCVRCCGLLKKTLFSLICNFLRKFASNKKTSKSNNYDRTLVCLFNHCRGSLPDVIGVRKI